MKHQPTHVVAWCALLISSGCSTTPGSAPQQGAPVGRLGYRLGTFLHLEGVRADSGKVGASTLRVHMIDGHPCEPPRDIWLDNLALPAGARCRLSGYESGRWIGIPPEVSEAEGLMQHQAAWQFQTYFIVTSVQSPESVREVFQKGPGATP